MGKNDEEKSATTAVRRAATVAITAGALVTGAALAASPAMAATGHDAASATSSVSAVSFGRSLSPTEIKGLQTKNDAIESPNTEDHDHVHSLA